MLVPGGSWRRGAAYGRRPNFCAMRIHGLPECYSHAREMVNGHGSERDLRSDSSVPAAASLDLGALAASVDAGTTKIPTERRRRRLFVVEARVLPIYVAIAVPPSLAGVAVVIAVIRAKKEGLPAIVRALMRMGLRDDECDHKRNDDSGKSPPSLPKP